LLNKLQDRFILICGGDWREIELFYIWHRQGIKVKTLGLEDNSIPPGCRITQPEMKDYDIIILPIWGIDSEGNVVTKVSEYSNRINVMPALQKNNGRRKLVLAGNVSEEINKAICPGVRLVLTTCDEELVLLNSILTAEGVIFYTLQNSGISIYNSYSLVLGLGRCGISLALRLQGLGAKVKVAVRNEHKYALAACCNLEAVYTDKLHEEVKKVDFLFNTVPSLVLNREVLKNVSQESLILDIAASPGGVDYDAAKEMGLKAMLMPGLPGKIAPRTAALNLAQVYSRLVLNNLDYLGGQS